MQRDSFFDAKKADLKTLESSIVERIEAETKAKTELEESFMGSIGNSMNDINAAIARETGVREDTLAELRDVLEVFRI